MVTIELYLLVLQIKLYFTSISVCIQYCFLASMIYLSHPQFFKLIQFDRNKCVAYVSNQTNLWFSVFIKSRFKSHLLHQNASKLVQTSSTIMKLLYKHTEHQSFSQDATKNATHSLTLKSPAMTPSLISISISTEETDICK